MSGGQNAKALCECFPLHGWLSDCLRTSFDFSTSALRERGSKTTLTILTLVHEVAESPRLSLQARKGGVEIPQGAGDPSPPTRVPPHPGTARYPKPLTQESRIALEGAHDPNSNRVRSDPIPRVPPAANPHDGNHGPSNRPVDRIPQERRVPGPGVVDEGVHDEEAAALEPARSGACGSASGQRLKLGICLPVLGADLLRVLRVSVLFGAWPRGEN